MDYNEYCARQKSLRLYVESEKTFMEYGYYTGKPDKNYCEFVKSGEFTEEQLKAIRYCLYECLIDSAWIDHPEYSPEKIRVIGDCLKYDYEHMYPAYTLTNPDLTVENIKDLHWFGYKEYISKEIAIELSRYSYSGSQMWEIFVGMEYHKLSTKDVSWYAHPDFHRNQMKVLKDALIRGLDVSKAANPKLPYFMMQEVIEITAAGGDVSIYDCYEFDNIDELNEIPMCYML